MRGSSLVVTVMVVTAVALLGGGQGAAEAQTVTGSDTNIHVDHIRDYAQSESRYVDVQVNNTGTVIYNSAYYLIETVDNSSKIMGSKYSNIPFHLAPGQVQLFTLYITNQHNVDSVTNVNVDSVTVTNANATPEGYIIKDKYVDSVTVTNVNATAAESTPPTRNISAQATSCKKISSDYVIVKYSLNNSDSRDYSKVRLAVFVQGDTKPLAVKTGSTELDGGAGENGTLLISNYAGGVENGCGAVVINTTPATIPAAGQMPPTANTPTANTPTANTPTDTTAPVINVLGQATLTLTQGSTYTDAGATCTDDTDGTITPTSTNNVNTGSAGTYQVTYSCTDSAGNSAEVSRTVNVQGPAGTPTADAGNDRTVNEGASVTLDGSGSTDPDGDTLTYSWTSSPVVTMTGANTATPSFTAPQVASNTAYTITLTVSDGTHSATDTVTITVRNLTPADTTAPVIALVGQATLTVAQGSTYTDAGATCTDDADGTITPISTNNVNTGSAGTYKVTYSCTDSAGNSAVEVSRTVNVQGPAGTPTADAGNDQIVDKGEKVELEGSGTDPDGDTLTYRWSTAKGITLGGHTTATPSFTAPQVASDTAYTFTLTVSDGAYSATDTVTITVRNLAPVITLKGQATLTLTQGSTYTDAGATCTDGMDGMITPTMRTNVNTDTAGTHKVTYSCTDSAGNSAVESRTVIVQAAAGAPTANAGNDRTVDVGTLVTLTGSGSTDPDGDTLTYSWTSSRVITGANTATPSFTAPHVTYNAAYTFTLTVSDGTHSDTDTVTITVRNLLPVITLKGQATLTIAQGSTYTDAGATCNDGTITPVRTYVNTDTAGTHKVTYSCTDSAGNSVEASRTVIVQGPAGTPTANAGNDKIVKVGEEVELDGAGSTDPNGDTLTYSWITARGITLVDHTTDAPSFTAPHVTSDTAYTFTLIVSDGTHSDTDTVTITVSGPAPAEAPADATAPVKAAGAPTANAGNDRIVNADVEVELNGAGSTDPDGDTLTYRWSTARGITLGGHTTDAPSFWAPQVASDTAYTFTLTVSDGTHSDTDTVTITVRGSDTG